MKKNRINPFYLIGGLIAIILAVIFFSVAKSGACDILDLSIVTFAILSVFCPLCVVLGLNLKNSEARS